MTKVYIETYGCQMNEYDTELIRGILDRDGVTLVDAEEQADVVLLNTCAVRENAHQKIYNRLEALKAQKRKGGLKAVGVLGCMAQSLRTSLVEQEPMVDIFAGPDSYKRLPEMLGAAIGGGAEKHVDFDLSEFETYSDIAPHRIPGVNAWIAVSRGCDNFCTFCVVPYTRGRERSRSLTNIVDEARDVVAQGFKQITLLGQNVNSYSHETGDFADLMAAVAQIEGLMRVRFTSPHPKDFPEKLLRVMARHDNLCKHIHLPLQSGSDAVLERMDRTYSKAEFLDLALRIRQILPGVSLTTDVICGFCGESESDFADTYQVMEQVGFDAAFIFKYSERRQTIASRKYADDVPDEVKIARVMRINALQRRVSRARNVAEVGRVVEVLIERPSKKDPHEWLARTDHFKGVVIHAPHAAPGDVVTVKITEGYANTLRGELFSV